MPDSTDSISALNAKPEDIRTFLMNYEYVIPDYQRPYSWKEEECNKLWEDLREYAKGDTSSPYFLGNVVVYPHGGERHVVDGQQRLITLSLLIRALFDCCRTYTLLKRMLYVRNRKTDEILDDKKIRITHKVFGENEHKKLEEVLIKGLNVETRSSYSKNYKLIKENVEKDLELEELIEKVIHNVVLLPIECKDVENALTIFETINNRGMDLNDADIFKSKLYKHSGEKKGDFIDRWDELVENIQKLENLELKDIFIQYMHILRGEEGNIDTLMGLRKFYDQEGGKRLKNWKEVMQSLEKLVMSWIYLTDTSKDSETDTTVLNLIIALTHHPNTWWQYPVMTFMHKIVELNENQSLKEITKDNLKNLKALLVDTTRYCYAIWLKKRSLVPMKVPIFKVVRDISKGLNFHDTYKESLEKLINKDTLKSMFSNELGRGIKGFCLLVAITNEKQKKLIIPKDFQIEHILPKKWEHYKYDGWNKEKFSKKHNRLANLVILEKKINVKASNSYFPEKKLQYGKSSIPEVQVLASLSNWTPDEFNYRERRIGESLHEFFYPSTGR